MARARLTRAIVRLEQGNLSSVKSVGERVFEYGVQAALQAAALGDHEQEALWYERAYEGLCHAREADADRSAVSNA